MSKGELKRYKGEEENSSNDGQPSGDGPEEASQIMPVNRKSKIVRDADVLRFSRASSLDQNFLVDADNENRTQNTISKIRLDQCQSPTVHRNDRDGANRTCETVNESQVNYLA